MDTAKGRQILKKAGAEVDANTSMVRFPRALVEESLRLAPKEFTLGARRPGWDLHMNGGGCTLLMDGGATEVLDRQTGERRPGLFKDWLEATRLGDSLDEVGVYWSMVEASDRGNTDADRLEYLCALFGNFSKHIQNGASTPEGAQWLLEVLQIIFGDRETIRSRHPISFLICPQSPLIFEETFTDAYLAVIGWDIPIAVMPMPLMGATAPGSLISTIIIGNCEVLAALCLVQAGSPGTPLIYAPALTLMNPRSGRYSSGSVENGVLGAAETEMARFYGLPVEASGGSTDHCIPSIQAGYERALNGVLTALSWPDILVGPGLLAGSMILSFEQFLIDVEVFRMCKQAHRGISADDSKWLEDVIERIGPGGNFLVEESTVDGIRTGEWYVSNFGMHDTSEMWEASGRHTLIDEAREKVERILGSYEPLPLGKDIENELNRIRKRAAG
ncbi:Glycine betaine methyltransferase [subsurface metagenome]